MGGPFASHFIRLNNAGALREAFLNKGLAHPQSHDALVQLEASVDEIGEVSLAPLLRAYRVALLFGKNNEAAKLEAALLVMLEENRVKLDQILAAIEIRIPQSTISLFGDSDETVEALRQGLLNRRARGNSTAQHSTAQHSTAQHSTAQHSTAQIELGSSGSLPPKVSKRKKGLRLSASDPHTVHPVWPDSRPLERYEELTNLRIRNFLSSGGIWIDVGAGAKATALAKLLSNKGVELVAVSPHYIDVPSGIRSFPIFIPANRALHEEYAGRGSLVTDIYGAVSYDDNPIEALIYEASLLTSGGKCIAVTEFERFGDPKNWDRIADFFKTMLGIAIQFEPFQTFADANQKWETALRITITGNNHRIHLNSAFDLVKQRLGSPHKVGGPIWTTRDGSYSIDRIEYRL